MTLERAFEDGPAFVPYVAAGDPTPEATERYVEALVAGGADAVELGLPFSEPIAEGGTIQAAIARSLAGGMTPPKFFDLVAGLDVDVPLVVMTYYNLIYQYGGGEARPAPDGASERGPREQQGVEPFVRAAAEAGIEGVVVPDLPVEEAGPLRAACEAHGLDLVFIVAPTTTDERLARIRERVSGYVYVQARLGTTGARASVSDRTAESLARVADWDLPKAVGFGISEGDHAERVVRAGADGVIVGSAVVDVVAAGHEAGDDPATVADRLTALARELKAGALRGATPRATSTGGDDPAEGTADRENAPESETT